ncbi:MAG: hypothetical protein JNN30_06920 [Rhodanobacteraceae bacterium]|nr:hypothetical protein [Rhodanobacteraceae bacterium]
MPLLLAFSNGVTAMRLWVLVLVVLVALTAAFPARSSDHADPALPAEFNPELVMEPNITGLFIFPRGDRLVLVFNVYKQLAKQPPYTFGEYEFVINMDLHSRIDYSDETVRARYGGHVVDSLGIKPDASITVHIDNNGNLEKKTVVGLERAEEIQWYVGVKADPFIFSPFTKSNVMSMVMSIPINAFPQGQQDWIIWGITKKRGSNAIIDHIGRGLRTQLPRFSFLNTLPPSEHVAALHKEAHRDNSIRNFIMDYLAPATNLYDATFNLRYYDFEPDVAIYTSRFPAKFPNGRELTDDIVGISCTFGDCLLMELDIALGKNFPRRADPGKPLSGDFPYLAEPWSVQPPAQAEKHVSPKTAVIVAFTVALAVLLLNFYFLYTGWQARRALRRLKHAS